MLLLCFFVFFFYILHTHYSLRQKNQKTIPKKTSSCRLSFLTLNSYFVNKKLKAISSSQTSQLWI